MFYPCLFNDVLTEFSHIDPLYLLALTFPSPLRPFLSPSTPTPRGLLEVLSYSTQVYYFGAFLVSDT